MTLTHYALGTQHQWRGDHYRETSWVMACGLRLRFDDASSLNSTTRCIPTCPVCAVLRDAALEGRLPERTK